MTLALCHVSADLPERFLGHDDLAGHDDVSGHDGGPRAIGDILPAVMARYGLDSAQLPSPGGGMGLAAAPGLAAADAPRRFATSAAVLATS